MDALRDSTCTVSSPEGARRRSKPAEHQGEHTQDRIPGLSVVPSTATPGSMLVSSATINAPWAVYDMRHERKGAQRGVCVFPTRDTHGHRVLQPGDRQRRRKKVAHRAAMPYIIEPAPAARAEAPCVLMVAKPVAARRAPSSLPAIGDCLRRWREMQHEGSHTPRRSGLREQRP
jgi:hypothetical protein